MFVCTGILYNHESTIRSESFVTRKITVAVARIASGLQNELRLGTLDAKRDWSYAGDCVEAMWRVLRCDTADDYVIGSGESHSVREFVEIAFGVANLDWQKYVRIDPGLARPREIYDRIADARKMRSLGWERKVGFRELVEMMTREDLGRFAA